MRNTKIDWCDDTWNPVTGCLHKCEYCYARGIANRHAGSAEIDSLPDAMRRLINDTPCAAMNEPHHLVSGKVAPYPLGFKPTLYRYRLDTPKKWSEPRTIFVCSMGDMFGEWMPDDFIVEVFRACEAAPQHRYLFLTKNPARYFALDKAGLLPKKENFYYGATADTEKRAYEWLMLLCTHNPTFHVFTSVEPMLENFRAEIAKGLCEYSPWVIVGAESGFRPGRVVPDKMWIARLVLACAAYRSHIFMKESLRAIVGPEDFVQEYPWEVRHE